MTRSKGAMASPTYSLLLVAFSIVICNSSPLPANITSADLGLNEGSCALGDVVYMPGDEFPGASPCERCSCANGDVHCAKQRCEPRSGCKAVHRPDHCCPTYQCECEQEGRIYDNGEKLLDPQDPCRVCYCQGGEVVCRRIACFVRDDCRPRLVPGRCCPEYDNCPVRGVTSLPGMTPSMPNPSVSDVEVSPAPAQPAEPVMPQSKITIKEITPISEIPVITNVKIKEILPSPSMEVAEYSSSKSPLIPREATSEKTPSSVETNENIDKLMMTYDNDASSLSQDLSTSSNEKSADIKSSDEPSPSKISLSTQQDTENIFEPKIPSIIPMMGGPSVIVHQEPLTTKAPILEEEDLDHNPAFPPIPDDLFLVLGNHEEEIVSDQNLDTEHVPIDHEVISVSSVPISTEEPIFKESSGSTIGYITETVLFTKNNLQEVSSESNTFKDAVSTVQPSSTSRENSMLNMRSVIPTDILNAPSLISDDVTGDMLDVTESSVTVGTVNDDSFPTEITDTDIAPKYLNNQSQFNLRTTSEPTQKISENKQRIDKPDPMTSILSKSTEIISRTEFSSIPIETSDQNPRETLDKDNKDKITAFTPDSSEESTSTSPFGGKDNTESKVVLSEADNQSFENGETTEFIMTSFGSQESTTDDIELMKVSSDTDKNSAIVEPPRARNNNVLKDLINLVEDVASISEHTTGPNIEHHTSSPTTISDSEELIPVNVAAGYKSKNKNWNLNSITEVPVKNKVAVSITKQKVLEIEDEYETITDFLPPHDKVEPTTKTPIIDNVSDDTSGNKTAMTDRKDFEIITKSYVPTINRRPTKVVMKKNEKPISGDSSSDVVATSTELAPESNASTTSEATSVSDFSATDSGTEEKTEETTELPNNTQ